MRAAIMGSAATGWKEPVDTGAQLAPGLMEGLHQSPDASDESSSHAVHPASHAALRQGEASTSGRMQISPQSPTPNQPTGCWPVVGLDAEWEPSESNAPVSVLQISTRDTAFLVDMLWFCQPGMSVGDSSLMPIVFRV